MQNIVLIQSDQVPNWTEWEEYLSKIEHEDLQGVPQFAKSRGRLLGVLEDRFGWDFIFKVAGGFIIEDRNAGCPVFYKTSIPLTKLREATKTLPDECVSWEKPLDYWIERFDKYRNS